MVKKYFCRALGFLLFFTGLVACNQNSHDATIPKPVESSQNGYLAIDWTQLMPQDDLDALLNPPDFLDEVIDGSSEDQIQSQLKSEEGDTPKTAYERALVSTRVIDEFNHKAIRLPGFMVPLQFNDELLVTEFFLVPFFGACLHLPPPPPNQIVFVRYDKGVFLESTEQPYWVEGTITTVGEVNDTAQSAYSMIADTVVIYDESETMGE